MINMAEIKFNKIQVNNFFEQNNIQLNERDKSVINSIFDECDVEDEQGQKGSDGRLSRGEVKQFIDKINATFGQIAQNFINYINGLAGEGQELNQVPTQQMMQGPQQNREIKEVECKLSEEEKAIYDQNLQAAKDICNKNKEQLGLTEEEMAFINNSVVKSEAFGAARFDSSRNGLVFNYNNDGDNSTGSLLKVLIHEATHASIRSEHNSKGEERQCETRALTKASELYKQGKLNDFEIMKGSGIKLSQLDTSDKISDFVEEWLRRGYNDLPEN